MSGPASFTPPDGAPSILVHILAHGEAERWNLLSKMTVAYDGYGVLYRTIQLAKAHFSPHAVHMVWAWPEFASIVPKRSTLISIAQPDRETLLHSMRYILASGGSGRACTVWLLGDVAYSNHLMYRISTAAIRASNTSNDDITFIGRFQPNPVSGKEASELFGVIVPREALAEFFWLVSRCLELHRVRKARTARLWDLYGLYHTRDEIVSYESLAAPVIASDDYSDDIDSPRELEQFYPAMSEAARKDSDIVSLIEVVVASDELLPGYKW